MLPSAPPSPSPSYSGDVIDANLSSPTYRLNHFWTTFTRVGSPKWGMLIEPHSSVQFMLYLPLSGSLLLDGERWKQADVPSTIQALVHRLEAGMISDVVTSTKFSVSSQYTSVISSYCISCFNRYPSHAWRKERELTRL